MSVTEIRPRSAAEVTHEAALQLGFAWHCAKAEDGRQCDEAGNDRAEFTAHMKGHGLKAPRPVRMIRLKATAPAASLGKLEVPVFKWMHWEQEHCEPGICSCGHSSSVHATWFGTRSDGGQAETARCEHCQCERAPWELPAPKRMKARRRGQFWSQGSRPHTVWVLPFEPAPWEHGRAKPVELRVSELLKA